MIFLWKTDQKSSQKVWKTEIDQKIDKNRVPGTTFVAKSRNSRDLGVPGVSLGEALGGISGEKFRGEKNDEKKVGKVLASAGYACPGKEGF